MVITMAHRNRFYHGLPFLMAWWIFPWRTVSHNQMVNHIKPYIKQTNDVLCDPHHPLGSAPALWTDPGNPCPPSGRRIWGGFWGDPG